MKGLRWTWHEMKLQWKNGFYLVYLMVNIIYIFMLGYVPQEYKAFTTVLLVLSDPTFLGMIFVGGILLLEKNQGIPKGIGVSPLGSGGYILGKVGSLLVIAMITGISILLAGGIRPNGFILLGIMLGGSLFTMVGIMLGSFARGINEFIGMMSVGSIIFSLPAISFYEIVPEWVFGWIPTYSILELLNSPGVMSVQIVGHSLYVLLWVWAVYKLTQQVVERWIFIK